MPQQGIVTTADGQKVRIQIAQHEAETGTAPGHAGDTIEETSGHAGAGEAVHGAAKHEGPHNPLAEHPPAYYTFVAIIVSLIILAFIGITRSKGINRRSPSKGQLLLEQCVASMRHFCENAIGPGGARFAPLVGTVFAFILVSNLMGVLPTVWAKNAEGGVAHFLPAPTANLSMTIALALIVFIVVQAVGIRENGFGGWFKHFMGPIPALAPLMLPLELIGALAKPLSLSIRLFGNIFGEETVIAVLVTLAASILPIFLPIPFQFPMLMFGIFGSLVQAGVFTILTCAYIALSIGEHGEHGHGHDHDHEHGEVKDELGANVPAHAH